MIPWTWLEFHIKSLKTCCLLSLETVTYQASSHWLLVPSSLSIRAHCFWLIWLSIPQMSMISDHIWWSKQPRQCCKLRLTIWAISLPRGRRKKGGERKDGQRSESISLLYIRCNDCNVNKKWSLTSRGLPLVERNRYIHKYLPKYSGC